MAVKCKQHHNAFACFDSPNLGGSTILILGTDLFTAPLKKLTHFHSALLITLNLNNALQCDNVQMKNHRKAKRSQGMVPKVMSEWTSSQTLLLSKLRVMSKWQNKSFLAKESRKMVLNPNERWLCVSGKRERASFRPPHEEKHPVTPLYKWHFNLLRSLLKRHFNVNTEFTIMSF